MNIRQQFIRGALWSAIEKWGAQMASTVVFLVLARLLEAHYFGLMALAHVSLSLMRIVLDQGFAQAIVQREHLEPEHLDTAFWTSVLMGVWFIGLALTGAGWIAQLYQEPTLAPMIRWMAFSVLLAGLSEVQEAILQRNLQFKAFAVRSLVATVMCGIAGIGAALLGFGVWSLVIKELVFGSTASFLLWIQSDWRPALRFSMQHFGDLFSFGVNLLGFNILDFLNRHADDILIGYFLGSVALGYYTMAYRLLIIFTQLFTKITIQVSFPIFSRCQNQPQKLRSMYYKITQAISLVSIPIFVGLSILAPELIQVLFGEQWLPSIRTMRILALAGTLQTVYAFNGTVFLAMNKPFWRLSLKFINALANITIFAILVRWGIVAIALGFVAREYVLFPLLLIMVKPLLDINFRQYAGQYGPAVAGVVVMATVMVAMKILLQAAVTDSLMITASSMTGALAYLTIISWLHPRIFQHIKTELVAFGK